MATSTRRNNTSEESTAAQGTVSANAGSLAQFTELARHQMLVGSQTLAALFRAGEGLSRATMQFGERAALLQGQAVENLRKATGPAELASVQATLILYQVQETLRYWQDLSLSMAALGSDMVRAPSAIADDTQAAGTQAAQQTATVASTMMDAAMSAAAPMADAIQQMFTGPLRASPAAGRAH